MANVKLSAIASGGALTAATDTLVAVRSGTTDVLVTPATVAGTGAASDLTNGVTGSGAVVLATSPTLVTPALGTPASGVATNLTGTASGLTAGTVTTNANLTGNVTSVGNATTIAANVLTMAIGVSLDGGGSALATGQKGYVTCPFAGTIIGWNITADTGTCTFDIWKIATGTAVPTVANTITASALPALATGTAIHSTTLSGWTTSVAANDIFGFNLSAVSGATKITLVIQVNKT